MIVSDWHSVRLGSHPDSEILFWSLSNLLDHPLPEFVTTTFSVITFEPDRLNLWHRPPTIRSFTISVLFWHSWSPCKDSQDHPSCPVIGNERDDIEIKDYVFLPYGQDNFLRPRPLIVVTFCYYEEQMQQELKGIHIYGCRCNAPQNKTKVLSKENYDAQWNRC